MCATTTSSAVTAAMCGFVQAASASAAPAAAAQCHVCRLPVLTPGPALVRTRRWTNGLFKSTLHRVVNTAGKERYSCAFFFEPNFKTRVECLPCCVSAERPAAYPPTTAGEHLLAKYSQTHAGYDVTRKQQQA